MTETPEPYLSTREAAERLNVSLRTVQLWVEAGLLRAWKTEGGHRRVLRSSVEELLAKRTRQASAIRGSKPARILVVESEPDARRLYELHLRSWGTGLDVETTANGFEALLRIGRQAPDFLVMDLKLPAMDGISMIRALRSNPPTRNLEIIVATSLARSTIRERGGLPAEIVVLGKPLRFDELRSLILDRIAARLPRSATA